MSINNRGFFVKVEKKILCYVNIILLFKNCCGKIQICRVKEIRMSMGILWALRIFY